VDEELRKHREEYIEFRTQTKERLRRSREDDETWRKHHQEQHEREISDIREHLKKQWSRIDEQRDALQKEREKMIKITTAVFVVWTGITIYLRFFH
jgi:hypothetical protein